MAQNGQLTRMFLAVFFVLLGVSASRAHVYFTGGDEGQTGLLDLPEFGGEKGGDLVEGGEPVIPGWNEHQLHVGLNELKHSLKSQHQIASKRSWLPGTQTGLFGKRGSHWLGFPADRAEKRQLWANQQSGLFGKRDESREQALSRWTVKRSAEESNFGRERKGGVPHVFKTGGMFGKRSAENWATTFE